MPDHDKSLFDRAKDALGMGGVDGAAQAAGSQGASGGTGASGAMGGAGAAGPVGAEPATGTDDRAGAAPADAVRTEYEMGQEFDPAHEREAKSGLFAEQSGEAEHDTWRRDEQGHDAEEPRR